METPVIWKRPDLVFPYPFDTVFFDVDGVLVQTTGSFRATNIAVAEYVAGTMHGLDWGQREGKTLVHPEAVTIFKQAGGYNNDRDMCYLLATLYTARLREWKGTPLVERDNREWMELSRAANLEGHGGIEWVKNVTPASAQLDYSIINDLYDEYYWGAAEYKKRFGRTAHYLPDFPGFVRREQMLFPADLPARLRDAGIRHLGMITGRLGPEVDIALERMEAYSGERWWEIVIPADLCAKPDPRALRIAIEAVEARGGLYLGDTADDLDLVLNYQQTKSEREPGMLAAMLILEEEIPLYQQRGADFIIAATEDVLSCLPMS